MTKIFFSLLLVFYTFSIQEPSEWELKKDQDYVQVSVRNLDSDTKEFLGETIVNGHIDSIFSFIMDFDHANQWMYKIDSSKIISPLKKDKFYVYFTVNINWPLTDRDLVMEVSSENKNNIRMISLYSRPEFISKDENYIRIRKSQSVWTLEHIDNKRTKVSLQSHSDVAGIPNWITDLFITQTPFYSLKSLRKQFD